MELKNKNPRPKNKLPKGAKGEYHEKIEVDATLQDLINMAESGKKKIIT